MKKIVCLFLCFLFTFGIFTGCGKQEDNSITVSRFAETKDGKVYYEVDGKPFMHIATEIRVDALVHCENQTFEELERFFIAAKNNNITTVVLPIDWSFIEPQKDRYTFRDVRTLLDHALRHGLKVEIAWFSTNMCGDSHSFHLPDYIWEDEETYKYYPSELYGSYWDYYGYQKHLWLSNPALLDRETKAATKLMEFVKQWDDEKGNPHTVIGVQVHNEPDAFVRWRLASYEVMTVDGSRRLTDIEAWNDVCTALDTVGKAFKSTDYKIITRTNLIMMQENGSNWTKFAPRIFNLEGIDGVGNDSYTTSISLTKKGLLDLASEEYNHDNYVMIAENKASYENATTLMAATYALGGGYNMYDIATPQHFINNAGAGVDFAGGIDHGLVWSYDYENPDDPKNLSDKPHTAGVRMFNKMLQDCAYPLILTKVGDIAAFNIKTDYPEEILEQQINTSQIAFTYKTQNGGVAMAFYYDGYVIAFTTENCELTLSNAQFSNAEYGSYDKNGAFTSAGNAQLNDSKLTLEKGKVYRVKADNLGSALTSNAIEMIG